jgi:hypothetical protein
MRNGAEVPLMKYDGSTNIIPVAAEAVVYSEPIDVSKGVSFGIWLLAGSATGTPTMKVELQHSHSLPAVAGAAETALWTIKEGASALFANINDKVAHKDTLTPVPSKYIRLKITGLATNPEDATLQGKIFIQEEA